MKWIVFQNLQSNVSARNYHTSIQITYLLNLKIVSVGLDEVAYFMPEYYEQLPLKSKVEQLLVNSANNLKEYEAFAEAKQSINDFPKIKNKSSKQIVAFNLLKKHVELRFTENVKSTYETLGHTFNLHHLRELVDHDIFYFYYGTNYNLKNGSTFRGLNTEILLLNLLDPENGNPMFFLSNFRTDGILMEIDFLDAGAEEAKEQNSFYGASSYIFPLLDSLTSTEAISTRKDLEKTTREFREKMDIWATICYSNPNTNLGLDYFRKNVQPLLDTTKNAVIANPFLQNVSSLTHKNLESQIIIGEAPINKIWELFLVSNTITQETFDELIKIKTEQFPKFEGRWPVVFYKPTEEAKNYMDNEEENDGIESVRKSISID